MVMSSLHEYLYVTNYGNIRIPMFPRAAPGVCILGNRGKHKAKKLAKGNGACGRFAPSPRVPPGSGRAAGERVRCTAETMAAILPSLVPARASR